MEPRNYEKLTVSEAIDKIISGLNKYESDRIINIALSGGKSVSRLYKCMNEKLCELSTIDTNKILLWVLDERDVDFADSRSNSRAISKFFRDFEVRTFDPFQTCCESYMSSFFNNVNNDQSFDMIIAGFGCDGHVASIFSDCSLDNLNLPQGFFRTENDFGEIRYSWTFKSIINANQIFFIVDSDMNKLDVWNESMNVECRTPLSVINKNTSTKMFFLI